MTDLSPMYFVIKMILRNLLLPPTNFVVLGLLGLLLMRRFRRTGIGILICSELCMFFFSTPLLADKLTHLVEHYSVLDLSQPTNAQAVVIIGGGGQRRLAPEYGGPAADYVLLDRLSYGAFVAKKTGLPTLVSGQQDETLAMATSLDRDFGVKVKWVEGDSNDTYQNARFTASKLQPDGIKNIILVTMSTHMYRAVQEFRNAGFDVTPAPTEVWYYRDLGVWRYVPNVSALFHSSSALYELIGEQARRVQAALGIRERFNANVAARNNP